MTFEVDSSVFTPQTMVFEGGCSVFTPQVSVFEVGCSLFIPQINVFDIDDADSKDIDKCILYALLKGKLHVHLKVGLYTTIP